MGTRVENIRTNIYINDKTAGKNLRQLTNQSRKLRNEIALLKPGTQSFINKTKELRGVNARIRSIRGEMNGLNNSWSKAANGFNKYAAMITAGAAALAGFAFSALEVIKRNAELSDSMADVMKTTGLTKQEVEGLYAEFGKMNTRTSRAELLKLAEEAGRLGITGKKGVLEFVRAANQLSVALGDDLGGEEAIRTVGKLTEQFEVGQKEGVGFEQAMLKMGSAINEVSASGATQASYLVDYMNRLVGASKQSGILAQQQIGYAAVLDEAGQAVEMSATAMSKLIIDMFTDTSEYAEVAKMDVGEFTELLNTDANEALLKVLEGLNGNNEGFSVMATKLEELGVDGSRAISVLSTLAGQTDKIREKQSLANTALQEGTSLTNEYNIKNENLAAGWERLQRAISAAFINSDLVNALKETVFWLNKLIEVPVSQTMEEERMEMRALELQIYDTNTPTEKRVELIKDLQTRYPDFLGNLNAEKVTNQELQTALQRVNEELLNKIIIQKQEEKIAEAAEEGAEAALKRMEAESNLRLKLVELSEKYGIELEQGLSLKEQEKKITDEILALNSGGQNLQDAASTRGIMRDINRHLETEKEAREEVNMLLSEKQVIMQSLGMSEDGGGSTTGGGSNTGAQAGDMKQEAGWMWRYNGTEWVKTMYLGNAEVEGKAIDARKRVLEMIKQLEIQFINDDYTRELAQIDLKYERMIAQAEGDLDLIKQLEEYKFQEKMKLMQEHLEKQADLVDDFQEELVESEIFNAQTRNDALIRADADLANSKMQGAQNLFSTMRGFAGEANDLQKTLFLSEKAVAVAQIVKNLQVEIAGIAAANAPLGPAGIPLTAAQSTAAKIRAGIGIATIAAQSIGNLAFAEGGYTGFGFGRPDHTGFKPAGVVHEGEYVIPQWMMQTDYVANVAGMLENIRTGQQGYAQGGPTSTVVEKHNTTNTTVIDQAEVVALLRDIKKGLNRPAIAVIGDKAVRDIDERMTRDTIIKHASKLV